MPNKAPILQAHLLEIRQDCIMAYSSQLDAANKLESANIAVTGGTGFLGTWIAEMVAALNDELNLKIRLSLYARNTAEWADEYSHLSSRDDIKLYPQDVRSPFQFQKNTNYIIHAAGVPNNRVHASDPLRVIQTSVEGVSNTLDAARQLDELVRLINVSSGLVGGPSESPGGVVESDCAPIPTGQLHLVYLDAKRSAESIAAVYRSQLRLPISTVRPFTFAGPYQVLHRPWAINNFLSEALTGRDIRIHGDGSALRSYLYGSDAAWWTLAALIHGVDGAIYNIGSPATISHIDLAKLICNKAKPKPSIVLNAMPGKSQKKDEFYPNLDFTKRSLQVTQTCDLDQIIDKTWRWFSAL